MRPFLSLKGCFFSLQFASFSRSTEPGDLRVQPFHGEDVRVSIRRTGTDFREVIGFSAKQRRRSTVPSFYCHDCRMTIYAAVPVKKCPGCGTQLSPLPMPRAFKEGRGQGKRQIFESSTKGEASSGQLPVSS